MIAADPRSGLADPQRYFFRKENRVLKRGDFLAAYDKGKRYRKRLITVFVYPRPEGGPTRLGLTATRKTGGAVDRNRLKRRAREVFRMALPNLRPGHDIIVNFHHASVDSDFDTIQKQLHAAWQDAGLFTDEPRREDRASV